jgi:hypothetical protein
MRLHKGTFPILYYLKIKIIIMYGTHYRHSGYYIVNVFLQEETPRQILLMSGKTKRQKNIRILM